MKNVAADPPAGCHAGPASNNLSQWVGSIKGPEGTPYSEGTWLLSIWFPANYPFKPPHIRFTTPIYHPNVTTDGYFHLRELGDHWSPTFTIPEILLAIVEFIKEPDPDNPMVAEIAYQYRLDRKAFNEVCKEHVAKYAM
jgi:ubiquitin-conjugating enzyme E2 D/E